MANILNKYFYAFKFIVLHKDLKNSIIKNSEITFFLTCD